MIILARPVVKPRGAYRCETCEERIAGTHLYMFGAADRGDKPYGIRVCLKCARNSASCNTAYGEKIRNALKKGEVKWHIESTNMERDG